MNLIKKNILIFLFSILIISTSLKADSFDDNKELSNRVKQSIFSISSFDPLASAIRIGEKILVTTRHSVADNSKTQLYLKAGATIQTKVIPNNLPGDLILLITNNLPVGPVAKLSDAVPNEVLRTVAADVRTRKIKVYKPGNVVFLPSKDQPNARIHHTAYSQPGNSGGALVNNKGHVVGIISSGGEGRFEAIPASHILRLMTQKKIASTLNNDKIGKAVRKCILILEKMRRNLLASTKLATALSIAKICSQTTNRQLFDLAASEIGKNGFPNIAAKLFKKSLSEDRNAINSRIGLLVSLSISMEYEKMLLHIRWLLKHNINDLQVLRLGIQSGIWGGDAALAKEAFSRLVILNPAIASTAKNFLENPPPRPRPKN